jgi:hypothetical protein
MTAQLYPVILRDVKTAISVPDATFERVTRRAKQLGMSRSELFATAAEAYLDLLDRRSLTADIDEAVASVGRDEESRAAVVAGRRRLAEGDW